MEINTHNLKDSFVSNCQITVGITQRQEDYLWNELRSLFGTLNEGLSAEFNRISEKYNLPEEAKKELFKIINEF